MRRIRWVIGLRWLTFVPSTMQNAMKSRRGDTEDQRSRDTTFLEIFFPLEYLFHWLHSWQAGSHSLFFVCKPSFRPGTTNPISWAGLLLLGRRSAPPHHSILPLQSDKTMCFVELKTILPELIFTIDEAEGNSLRTTSGFAYEILAPRR